jgi:hypothetical protein
MQHKALLAWEKFIMQKVGLTLTMCSCVLWDYQTMLYNWVVIKVVFGCMRSMEWDMSDS